MEDKKLYKITGLGTIEATKDEIRKLDAILTSAAVFASRRAKEATEEKWVNFYTKEFRELTDLQCEIYDQGGWD